MAFQLNLDKAIEASAYLLARREASKQMTRLRLLKLLYLAERESLEQTGYLITSDRAVAMDHGPVLSSVYNLIKGDHVAAPRWSQFFENEGFVVRLKADPGMNHLCESDLRILEAVDRLHWEETDSELRRFTHNLPEWKKNEPAPGGSEDISLDDMAEAVGRSDEVDSIRADEEYHSELNTFLNGLD